MPWRAALVLTQALLALGCACNRTEEPAAPSTPEPPAGGASAAPSGGASANPGGGSGSTAGGSPITTMPMQPSATAPLVCTVPFETAPVASKAAQCPKDPSGNLTLPRGKITFTEAPKSPVVDVELARDDASRERGLMYRTSMAESGGMLFTWEDERIRSFWMHNTCIPLDLLYITKDGVISGILEQVPTMNDAPRRVACPVAHVLELNAGWARAHGIAPGMKVTIEG